VRVLKHPKTLFISVEASWNKEYVCAALQSNKRFGHVSYCEDLFLQNSHLHLSNQRRANFGC